VTRCPSDLALERYLLGELDGTSEVDHVQACARCRELLAAKRAAGAAYMRSPDARELARKLAAAEPVVAELEPPVRPRRRRVAVAGMIGAIVAAIVITMLVWPRQTDHEAEVLGVAREWMDAYRHNDVAALDRILADDYKLTDSLGRTSTKADDLATARSGLVHLDVYDTTDLHVRVWGDTAVVTGHSVIRGASPRGRFVHDFNFTDTLARIDGSWRAVAAHVSRSPQQP